MRCLQGNRACLFSFHVVLVVFTRSEVERWNGSFGNNNFNIRRVAANTEYGNVASVGIG